MWNVMPEQSEDNNHTSKINVFSHAYTEMATFYCLKRGKKIPFLGYTWKMWELSIIPVVIINNSRIWGTIARFASALWFFRHFLPHQVSPSNGPKGKFVAKTWKYGQPTSSLWKPTIGVKLSLSNLLTDEKSSWITLAFFVCTPKKGFFSRVSGKKVAISMHAREKIKYAAQEEQDDSHSCFCALASLVRDFTLLRIILFLPCSINIYSHVVYTFFLLAGQKMHFLTR